MISVLPHQSTSLGWLCLNDYSQHKNPAISLLLVSSWSYGVTREYWDWLDRWVFDATNPLLNELGGVWSWFWAVLSIH
jgi:hypothetical protein